jgi:hypothetical protein
MNQILELAEENFRTSIRTMFKDYQKKIARNLRKIENYKKRTK